MELMRRSLLLLTLVLTACGASTATTLPTATTAAAPAPTTTITTSPPTTQAGNVPDGYTLHGSEALGFEVALPDEWFVADLTSDDINDIADSIAADNPEIADLIRSATSSGDFAFRFWAFDLDDSADDFVTNVNVTAFPPGPLDDPVTYQDALGPQYESLGGEVLSTELVQAGGDGLYVEMRLPLTSATGQPVTSNGYQIFVFTESEVVNISLSTDEPDEYAETIAVMRETFVAR